MTGMTKRITGIPDRTAGAFRPVAVALLILTVAGCAPARQTHGVSLAPKPEAVTASGKPGCAQGPLNAEEWGGQPFRPAPVLRSRNGTLTTDLVVDYHSSEIAGCQTHLRGYDGALVGRTLRVRPGETLSITLRNQLLPDGAPEPDDVNTPHNFNTTNFHSHGLHVSPAGNADNVLRLMPPQSESLVEIHVPQDHPTGTFWYHSHVHGSTALQVSSGMAGAIIVENPDDPRSLDSVPEIRAAKDQVLLLQQISYDANGEIENYDQFGPGGWAKSGRLPTINGQIMPVFELRPGEVQRWRLIHGGIRETFQVGITRQDGSDPWTLHEIALDGLSLGYMNSWTEVELQPGYRSDILVKAPPLPPGATEAVYYVYDQPTPAEKSLLLTAEARQPLAKVVVRGTALAMALPCAASGPGCAALAPTKAMKDITEAELTGPAQAVSFMIGQSARQPDGRYAYCPDDSAPECALRFMVNARPFPGEGARQLTLGTASEWTVQTLPVPGTPDEDRIVAAHPFHIHVNPFQMVRPGPDGAPETVWRDTQLVRPGDVLKLRSRYEDYIGTYVLHCHILDHEDQGMMELVDVVEPGGTHGAATPRDGHRHH